MNNMPLIADPPPSTRPRGTGTGLFAAVWPPATSPQFAGESTRATHAGGCSAPAGGSAAPASSNSTDASGFSDSRAASTHPAVPPPTITKS